MRISRTTFFRRVHAKQSAASEPSPKDMTEGRLNSYNGCMRTISSVDAKNRFGQLLDAAQRAPVAVTKKGRPAAVVMSVED